MQLCNDTITVFCKRINGDTGYDEYTGTIITGVSWFGTVKVTVDASGGLKSADVFTVRIPVDADFGGKYYVSPQSYAQADPDNAFTLQNGGIIIRGAVTLVNPRPAEIFASADDTFTIMGITDNRRAYHAPHWKVVGA
jgi:hypothetical protein